MSKMESIISTDHDIWDKIQDKKLKEDFTVQQAVYSGLVQAVCSVFVEYRNEAVKSTMQDAVAEILVNRFEVPQHRIEEVFERADAVARLGANGNGEA